MGIDEEEDTDVDVEVLDGNEIVEVSDAEVAAELVKDPVTKPHDGGEFLTGFRQGVGAGRKDVYDAVRRLFGDSPMAIEIVRRVMEDLKD